MFIKTVSFLVNCMFHHHSNVPQTMPWLFTGNEDSDSRLREAYESVIHITSMLYVLGEDFNAFKEEVRINLMEEPFNSNLSSISEVS